MHARKIQAAQVRRRPLDKLSSLRVTGRSWGVFLFNNREMSVPLRRRG